MAFRKRVYRKKRRVYRRKAKKPAYIPGIRRRYGRITNNPQFMKVKRTFQMSGPVTDTDAGRFKNYDLLCASNTNDTCSYNSGAWQFYASQVPNISEFGTLFDQYRIVGVKLMFVYSATTEVIQSTPAANETVTAFPSNFCTLFLMNDFDDTTSPPQNADGIQAMIETGRCKKRMFPGKHKAISIYMKPRQLTAVYDTSGTQTGKNSVYGRWNDGATALDASYIGLKWAIQANPTLTYKHVHSFRCFATYYLQFRQRQ